MMKQILIKRKPGILKTLSAWLFLILIPIWLFDATLQYLFTVTEKSNQLLAKETLINEITGFEKDLHLESFLERLFRQFSLENSQVSELKDAKEFSRLFMQKTGVPLSGLIIHGKDCKTLDDVYFSELLQKNFIGLSKTFTLKFFAFINRQHLPEKNSDSEKNTNSLLEKQQNLVDGFFQKQFGLISMVPILPMKIATSISVKLGGVAYFYYQPVSAEKDSEKTIAGGWLAIVRGKKIDPQLIMDKAAKLASDGVTRTFISKRIKIPRTEKEEFLPATNFQIEEDGMSLQCPVPQNLLAHLVGEGGFYPENLEKVTREFPFLKVKIKNALLEHSLKQYYPLIRLLETLLLLSGALIALRLYFFGLEFKTRLASKAIIGIIIAAALPFSLLIISFFTYIDVAEKAEIIEINNLLKQQVETISSRVINFTGKFHQQAYLLSRALEVSAESEIADQELIKSRLVDMRAQEVFLDFIGKKTINITNPSLPSRPICKDEFTLGQIISRSFLDSLSSIELYNDETVLEQENLFRDVYFVDSNFINNSLNGKGRLLEIDQIKSLNSFSLNPVFYKNTTRVAGFLTVKFNQLELINLFLRDFKTDQNKADVKISIFSFRNPEKKGAIKAHTGILNEKIIEKISQAQEVGSHIFWRSDALEKKANCLFVLPKFPLIIMAEKKLNGRLNPFWPIFFSLCYMLLLIISCYHFFARELLQPIEKLSEAAITAGQGNFKTRTDFYAEGEFLILKNAFNEMVTGMAQKEKLAQFVSREVLETLDENISSGKKIEATVIFAAIKGFSSWIRDGHQDEVVNSLNLAISTTDRLAEKHCGNLDKVIGNTLMIVFRNDDHAARACRMTLELQHSLGLHNIVIQSGVASGNVISGSIGDANGKIDLTVIGDPVNLAARLKGFAQESETAMIITAPSTIRALKGLARLRFIKKTKVKGKSREFPIYQLLELRV